MCGNDFKGKSYRVYDENWKWQRCLTSCGCHLFVPLTTYDHYKKAVFSDLDIQQNANNINDSDL